MAFLATFQQWVKKTRSPLCHNSLEPITKTTWKPVGALEKSICSSIKWLKGKITTMKNQQPARGPNPIRERQLSGDYDLSITRCAPRFRKSGRE
jgi:hypothetical protein